MKDITNPDFATPEKQEARAFLRERFLRALTSVIDKECTINLYDKTTVTAKFGGTDMDVLKLFVKDLTAPVYNLPHAMLRTTDILSVEVPKASYQKLLEPQEDNMEDHGK